MTEGKASGSTHGIAWGRYLLIFFVAAWMFVLGVLVGRGTAPVHFDTQALQKELAGLRDAMMNKEREAVEKAIRGEDEKAPLEFYEALKDGPDAAFQLPVPQASAQVPADASASADASQPPHKTRAAVMTKKTTLTAKAATETVTSTTQRADTPAALTIQVASLKDAAAAQRIVTDLKKAGYPAYLSRIVIAGKGIWFRVRVGSYKDREEAAADMNRLIRDQKKPILVKR